MIHRTRNFCLFLFACFLLCATKLAVYPVGDYVEYTLTAVAFAQHGTPDIRASDAIHLLEQRPELRNPLEQRIAALQQSGDVPDMLVARDGRRYTLHFFGYSLLAAPFMKLFEAVGGNPLRGFLVVNLGAIFVLGLALYRWLGSARRTLLGLALFLLCGGWNYLRWTSPEILSAAGLLSALILVTTEAPLAAGLVAGLAAWQTPSILLFFGAAPFLAGSWRIVPRLLPGALLAALPLLFNQVMFGTPTILGVCCSSPALLSWTRFLSFFFDLNQGMLIGFPGVMAVLLVAGWRTPQWPRLLAVGVALVVAMALPPLMVHNWNSGAVGLMRYAFWAGMPLLFLALWRWRDSPRVLAALLALQVLATAHAMKYSHVEFSPIARLVLRHAPGWYRPEAEIFRERTQHTELVPRDMTVTYSEGDRPLLTNIDDRDADSEERVCGKGRELAPGSSVVTREGWRYIAGVPACQTASVPRRVFRAREMRTRDGLVLGAGWSGVEEADSGDWSGVWSDGPQATMTVAAAAGLPPRRLRVNAVYLPGNRRTRVSINGVDLGWHDLASGEPIDFTPTPGPLTIVFVNEAPHAPTPTGPDQRKLAVFMKSLVLY